MSKNSIEDKKKSHLKGNICRSHWSPDSVWNNKTQAFRINSTNYEMTLTFAQEKKKQNNDLSQTVFNHLHQLQCRWFFIRVEFRGSGNQELQLIREDLTHGHRRLKTCLSGWVGAGTGAVTSTAGWSGARAAACWGPPPWGAGPMRRMNRWGGREKNKKQLIKPNWRIKNNLRHWQCYWLQISQTFSSSVVDCGATWVVGGAFCEGEKVYEVEDGLAVSAQQMQWFPVHQSDL